MKNKLYILVFIIALILLFPKSKTMYSGTYYAGSTNEGLILKSDNSFEFSFNENKNSITVSGKYKISKNHIVLSPDDKKYMFLIDDISSGEINGSSITFKEAKNVSSTVFTKS